MARASRSLRRFVVLAASTATIAGGIVPLTMTSASAVTSISITPPSDTETVGNCNPYTVTSDPNTAIDVQISQAVPASPTATAPYIIGFCPVTNFGTATQYPNRQGAPTTTYVAGAPAATPTCPTVNQTTTAGEAKCDAVFTTDPNGKFTFGVKSNQPGTMNIVAYQDTASPAQNHQPDTFEQPQATATKTWVANQASSITCQPTSATNPSGTQHNWTCNAKTSSGTGVNNTTPTGQANPVDLKWVVTGTSPDAGQNGTCSPDTSVATGSGGGQYGNWNCGPLNNIGGTGTDTINVWVDNNGNGVADTGEPTTQIHKTWVQPAPAGSQLSVTCSPNQTTTTPASNPGVGVYVGKGAVCQDPTTDKTVTITAKVVNGTPAAGQSGVLVNFGNLQDLNGTADANDTESLSANSCTTGANGTCSVTFTDTSPVSGESWSIDATMTDQSGNSWTATVTKNWATPNPGEARNIAVAPKTASQPSGGVQAFTATVTDRFGNPVPKVLVTWSESGPGAFRSGNQCTTDATGKCSLEVISLTTESGDETVTATIDAANYAPNGPNGTTTQSAANTGAGAPTGTATECNAAAGYSFFTAGDNAGNAGTYSGATVTPNANGGNNTATGAPAGNCTDSGKVTWVSGTQPSGAPTINVSQPNKTAGTNVTFSGTSSDTVTLSIKNASTAGAFQTIVTITPTNGQWTYTMPISYNSVVRATNSHGSTDATVNVNVKVTITDIRYLGKDARGKCVTRFLGGTFPYIPGAPAWIRNSAVSPTQPIGFTRVFQFGSSGRYDARFGLACGQTYKLFSLISGTGSDGVHYTDNGVGKDIVYKAGTTIATGQ